MKSPGCMVVRSPSAGGAPVPRSPAERCGRMAVGAGDLAGQNQLQPNTRLVMRDAPGNPGFSSITTRRSAASAVMSRRFHRSGAVRHRARSRARSVCGSRAHDGASTFQSGAALFCPRRPLNSSRSGDEVGLRRTWTAFHEHPRGSRVKNGRRRGRCEEKIMGLSVLLDRDRRRRARRPASSRSCRCRR